MFDPEVLQILGLNLLAGKSPNFAENLGNAGLATMQYQRQQEEDKYRKEERDFLKQQREMQLADMKRRRQTQEAIAEAFKSYNPQAAAMASMPSLAPTLENASLLQAKTAAAGPGSRQALHDQYMNVANLLRQKGALEESFNMEERAAKLLPESAGIEQVTDPSGKRILVQRFKDGTIAPLQYGPKPDALHFVNTGDRVGVGVDPFSGEMRSPGLAATMSPEQQFSANARIAELGINRAKAAYEGVPGLPGIPGLPMMGVGRPSPAPQPPQLPPSIAIPAGLPPSPTITPSPVLGLSPKQQRELAFEGAKGEAKRAGAAPTVLDRINEAESLLKQSATTGSYVGRGVDYVARATGKATEGDKNTAALQTISGALLVAMPRMEGPQSDRDVENYKDAAGRVADATVPREVRLAAIKQLREIYQRYAGINTPTSQFDNGKQSGGASGEWGIKRTQ